MAGDLRCLDDLDLYGAECGDALEEYLQDMYHRLLERAGENLDDQDRGLGLEDELNAPISPGLSRRITQELEKDPRTTAAKCKLDVVTNGNGPATVTIGLTLDVNSDELNLAGYSVTIIKDANGIRLVQA